MNANETTLLQRPNDVEVNNYLQNVGHRTAFCNVQNSYRKVSGYKGFEMTNLKQYKREN